LCILLDSIIGRNIIPSMAVEDLFWRGANFTPEDVAERDELARHIQIVATVLEELRVAMSVDTYPDLHFIEQRLRNMGLFEDGDQLYSHLPTSIELLTSVGDELAMGAESMQSTPTAQHEEVIEAPQLPLQDTRLRSKAQRIGRGLRLALPR
jgi:hypothetical protein